MEWKTFVYEVRSKEHQMDSFGHVNHVQYFQLLEEARWQLLEDSGLGFHRLQEIKQGPVILNVQIDFKRELGLREMIRIESRMLSIDGKIGVMEQKMLKASGELAAMAKITYGVFDLTTRKLIAPTAEWLKAVGALTSP